jgi:hypothetical protein
MRENRDSARVGRSAGERAAICRLPFESGKTKFPAIGWSVTDSATSANHAVPVESQWGERPVVSFV